MNTIENAIELRDNAKCQLLQIKSVEDGISYLNKLSAIDKWVKAEKLDAELQNIVAEQKLRTQRILGQLLRESELPGRGGGDVKSSAVRELDTLDDIGISRKQSSTFQQIASIPDETFEGFIHEKKSAVNDAVAELTTSGAVRLARSLKDESETIKIIEDGLEKNEEIRKLAKHINITYTKDQRKTIVSLIKI